MLKTILSICKSCNQADHKKQKPTQGSLLLSNLDTQISDPEIEIRPVECMWTCSRACSVAISSLHKCTWYFMDLPPENTTVALAEFAHLYHESPDGSVDWKNFPKELHDVGVIWIPGIPSTSESTSQN
jgi:predicted metal-binding protein